MNAIKRLVVYCWLLLCLLLAACATQPPPSPSPTAAPPTETAAPTAEPTAISTAPPTPTPAAILTETASAPTASPEPPTPTATPPPTLEGFTDGLLLATHDAALVIYYPGSGERVTLLEPGLYDAGDDNFLIPIGWPVRFAPGQPADGQRVLIPTPNDGTWLATVGEAARKFHELRLFATWSPDGERITYAGQTGQFARPANGDVFVADPSAEPPREPLASLPGSAGSAVWSPTGDAIAVATTAREGLMLWLLDADTGEARELGAFRPPAIGGTLFHRWAADGSGVIAQADMATLFFPLDGTGPRPLFFEANPAAPPGELSPDGTRYARLERDRDGRSTLVFGDAATGQELAAPTLFSQGERFYWSDDGRYVLTSNYGCAPKPCRSAYEVWAVDTSDFPALGEATLIATGEAFLGPLSALVGRGTEVDAQAWAVVEPLPAAGPPETWTRHDVPAAGLSFAAPAGWRVMTDGDRFTVANYAAVSPGYAPLTDEQIRIDGRWSGRFGNALDYTDLEAMREMHFNWDVELIEVDGTPGVLLRDRVAPLCEHVLLPHDGGELTLSYCPTTEQWRGWIGDFLVGLNLLTTD